MIASEQKVPGGSRKLCGCVISFLFLVRHKINVSFNLRHSVLKFKTKGKRTVLGGEKIVMVWLRV